MFWNQLADSISVLCGLAQVKLRTKEWRNSFGRAPVNTSRKRLVNKQSISVDWAFNFERKKKKDSDSAEYASTVCWCFITASEETRSKTRLHSEVF